MGVPVETFLDRCEELDENIWAITNPDTGSDWASGSSGAYLVFTATANATKNCRILSKQQWSCSPYRFANESLDAKFVYEFIMQITDPTNLDDTNFFVGLSVSGTATRASTNIIGIGSSSGIPVTIVDAGGVESATTQTGYSLGDTHKYRIEIYALDGVGNINLWIDDVLIHNVEPDDIEQVFYKNFYLVSGAGGATAITIKGPIKSYFDYVSEKSYQDNIPMFRVKEDTDVWFPIRLMSVTDPREYIVGKLYDEITIKYGSNSDTSLSSYTISSGQWVEYEDGLYKMQMGASEFTDDDEIVIVTVADDRQSSAKYMFMAQVNAYTVDEVYTELFGTGTALSDTSGDGDPSTYNITNLYNTTEKNTKKQNAMLKGLKEIMITTKNQVNKNKRGK